MLSDVFCVSGRLMLQALLDGHLDAEQIAELAKKKARVKIPQIAASIAGHRLTDHQRFQIRHALLHLQFLETQVEALNQEILRRIEDPALAEAFQLLQSIPGIKEESAASILAEVGADIAFGLFYAFCFNQRQRLKKLLQQKAQLYEVGRGREVEEM